MRVTARADYAVRALLELAASSGGPLKLDQVAAPQGIPSRFLEHIFADLRRAGLVISQRGSEGGYRLARLAADITVADVMRAVEGPLANVQGVRPEEVRYEGVAEPLRDVWVAMRAALRSVLEQTTLADIAAGALPSGVTDLLDTDDAWAAR